MRPFGKRNISPESAIVPGTSDTPGAPLSAQVTLPEEPARFIIPRIVKRNTLRLAVSQAFVGTGTQMIPALGALAILQLTHSASLTGIGTAIIAASRFIISYPAGKISDRFGRKAALIIGLALGIVGAPLIGFSIMWGSFPLLLVGFLIFSMGMGMTQQLRVAAADMYSPSLRGLGTGYVLMGSLVGAVIAPGIISLAQNLSPGLGIDPLGLPWLFIPLVSVPAMILVFSLRPDPKDIAQNLSQYYPGYQAASRDEGSAHSTISLKKLLGYYPTLTVLISSLAAQGNMAMMMFITSLVMKEHGHTLAAISVSVSIHVIGMFAFSVPIGKLADKFGRRAVLLAGVVIAGAGSMLVPLSPYYFVITSGTFLVGLGWSAVYVASTALIADICPPDMRGRAIGINDTISYFPGIVLPLVAGPLAATVGLVAVGWLGMLLMVPAFGVLLFLREARSAKYL